MTVERRQYEREQVKLDARVVFGKDNTTIACTIVDRSMRGLRVRLPSGASVPNEFYVLELATGAIHEATVVWKSYPDIGLSIRSTQNVRASASPKFSRLRDIWRDATSQR